MNEKEDARNATYHGREARIVETPRNGTLIVPLVYGSGEGWLRERENRAMKHGIAIGFLVGLLALCLTLWLWAIPTVEGALKAVGA